MEKSWLKEILVYIDAHIQEKITLRELADLAGYTPFYFSRLFSEALGMPVTGYIRIRKLQYAIASLLEGRKVLEVSLLYAFESPEGFTRSFKQLFGSTPDTVRRYMTSYHIPPCMVPAHTTAMERSHMEQQNTQNLQANLQQLVYEVLTQSLTEALEGHCSKISLWLMENGAVRISDNGRGIPLTGDNAADKTILDKILSGCPISDMEYRRMGDFSQIGMQTVNSLCESLQVRVYRGGHCFCQDYVRGIPQHEITSCPSTHRMGTQITLLPDRTLFGDTIFSCELLRKWLADNRPEGGIPTVSITDLSQSPQTTSS